MRLDAYDFIEKGPDLIRMYLTDIQAPSLTSKQEAKATPEELVKHNLQLVPFFAKNYRGRGLNFLDLIQEGNFGLIRASEKFDGKRGFRFSTYASWWIKRSIVRGLQDNGRTIRVPSHIHGQTEYAAVKEEWLDRTVVVSFEDFVNEDGETVEGFTSTFEEVHMDDFELRKAINKVLSSLDEDERELIKMKFGVADGEYVKSHRRRGKKVNKDHNTVGEIERRAMTKLRCPSLSRKLRPFVAATILFFSSLVAYGQCDQIAGTQVPLYWDANTETNIDYYRLQRSSLSGSGYTVVNTVLQGPDPISLTDFNPIPEAYYVVSAVDTSGLESGLSNELCVVLDDGTPPPDTTLPVIAITSPANNETISGVVLVMADATDNVSILNVQFRVRTFLSGILIIGTDSTVPYSASWDSTGFPDDDYQFTATATDTSNNQATTPELTVFVDNSSVPPDPPPGSPPSPTAPSFETIIIPGD